MATGVTVTVFSVRQVLAATSGFSLSGDALRAMDDKQFVSQILASANDLELKTNELEKSILDLVNRKINGN